MYVVIYSILLNGNVVNRRFMAKRRVATQEYTRGNPHVNPLKPNDAYRGRTAPLTSKIAFYIFIQPI